MKQYLVVYSLFLFVHTPPFHAFLVPYHTLKYKTSSIKGKNLSANGGPASGITEKEYHLRNDKRLRTKILQDRWNKQLNRFNAVREKNDSPSQRLLVGLLALSAAIEEWDVFKTVQDSMQTYGFASDDKNTYRTILKECMSNGNGIAALKVLEEMKSQSNYIKPCQEDLKLTIIALCRQNKYSPGLWKKAMQLIYFAAAGLEKGELEGDPISVEAYNQLMYCLGDDSRWEDVLELLGMMEDNSGLHPPPTLATYDRALSALISSNRVDVATDLLLSMAESKNIVPTIYSYENVLSAILRQQSRTNWKSAIKLIDSMQELKILAPTVLFNRVISACAKARELKAASDVFQKMKAQNIPADTVTYNSLIAAAANTGRANAALRLFEMCKEDTGVDIITYTNTIR
jgi:pentatricopeptide repeat protein